MIGAFSHSLHGVRVSLVCIVGALNRRTLFWTIHILLLLPHYTGGAFMLGQFAASLGPPRSSQRRSPTHKSRQRSRQHHIRTFQTVRPWMIPLPGRVIRRRWARLQPRGPWRRTIRRTPYLQIRAHPLPTRPPRWSTSTRTPRSACPRQYVGSN